MSYDLKSVFYLDTSVLISKTTAGAGSGQLDLSAYIDPIARGRTKGTGLAIYKVHYSIQNSEDANEIAPEDSESGVLTYCMSAGAGLGDNATGALSISAATTLFDAGNVLNVAGGQYYGPASYPGARGMSQMNVMPSKDVPYVIVRDNVCLVYNVSASKTFESTSTISVRLECAQIALDQATLNQLLRTQTV